VERFVRVRIAAMSAALVFSLLLAAAPAAFARRPHIDIDAFMTGLACVESTGRYDVRNSFSRAYGKYQIMPRIWGAWAARYMGNRWAEPTPRNQEFVARQRITDLMALHHRWRLVAHWWLTGNAGVDQTLWSVGSTHYVDEVMSIAHAAMNRSARAQVPTACFPGNFRDPKVRTSPWPRARTIGRVFVRFAAGYESRAIGTLHRNSVVAVLDKATDARGKPWLRVGLSDGRTAWIAAWYTRPLSK
jgi:hypothetical protein